MYCDSSEVQAGVRGLRLLKVSVGEVVRVSIQSPDVEVVGVHWFGRQVICGGGDCLACTYVPVRLVGFCVVQVDLGGSAQPALLEMTGGSWSRCRLLCEMEGLKTTQGLVVELRKPRSKSGIRVEPVSVDGLVNPVLATAERLVDAISVLFSLPRRNVEETAAAWKDRVRASVVLRCSAALAECGGKS